MSELFRYLEEGLGEAGRLRERMRAFARAAVSRPGEAEADRGWAAGACAWIADLHGWLSGLCADLTLTVGRLLAAAGAARPIAAPVAGPAPVVRDPAEALLLWLGGWAALEATAAEAGALMADLGARGLSDPAQVLACRDLLIRLALSLGEASRLHRHLEGLARWAAARAAEGG